MTSQKERIWLAEYLKCFDATAAARRAGYKWPGRVGWQKKEKFADEIAAALEERAMGVDEALAHLADIARADISAFVNEDGIDIEGLKEAGFGHLIASARRVQTKFDDRLEVDIYDRMNALKIIMHHLDKGPAGTKKDPQYIAIVNADAEELQ